MVKGPTVSQQLELEALVTRRLAEILLGLTVSQQLELEAMVTWRLGAAFLHMFEFLAAMGQLTEKVQGPLLLLVLVQVTVKMPMLTWVAVYQEVLKR